MKRSRVAFSLLTGAVVLAGMSADVTADTKSNPYDAIVERNPFGLKPPPPPPDPSTNVPPPAPAPTAQVEVTGFLSVFSRNKVLLEVIPAPGKPMLKPVLSEGERIESVEVMAINVEKNEVTIKNGSTITNLTFKVAKSTPAPASPVPGVIPPSPIATPMPAPVQTSYNQNSYNQNQGSGRYAVMMAGGNSSTPAANPANPAAFGGSTSFGSGGVAGGVVTPGATVGATDGFRQIPSRNIRTATPQNANAEAAVSREQQYRSMEQQRLVNEAVSQISGKQFPPLPPTPYTPPDAPAGRTPPPIPGGFPPSPR